MEWIEWNNGILSLNNQWNGIIEWNHRMNQSIRESIVNRFYDYGMEWNGITNESNGLIE